MKKIITGIAVILLMALAFTACQKDNTGPENKITDTQLTPQQVQQVALMKEASLAIGKTIKNSEARNYLVTLVRVKNDNSEAISMAALLGAQANITKYEKDLLAKGFKQRNKAALDKSFFARELLNTIYNNPAKYPMLSKNLPHEKSSASTIDELNALRKELASQNLEIYLPYEKDFDWDKISSVTVTWHPLVRDTWNVGNLIALSSVKSAEAEPVSRVDDNYAADNPTVVVRPINNADYVNIIAPGGGNGGGNGGGSGGGTGTTFQWVTSNLDYTKVPEKDVLVTYIPKLRLRQNYRDFFGGSSHVMIYRVFGKLKFDSKGYFVPSTNSDPYLGTFIFTRRDVKYGHWKDENITFDDNWQEHKNTEQFVVVSVQGLLYHAASLTIKGDVKVGYDVAKKKVTFEPKIDVAFTLSLTGNKKVLKYNNYISRRSALATITGKPNPWRIMDDGHYYNIKSADQLDYYYKFYWEHVAK